MVSWPKGAQIGKLWDVNPEIPGRQRMSALVRIPDSSRSSREVRFVPIGDISLIDPVCAILSLGVA